MLSLNASTMQMSGINLCKYTINGIAYKIDAKLLYKDLSNFRKQYNYFNRTQLSRKYNYIEDGIFKLKNFNLSFKKQFQVANKIYFDKVSFINDGLLINSKECSINLNDIKQLNCKRVKFFDGANMIKIKRKQRFKL